MDLSDFSVTFINLNLYLEALVWSQNDSVLRINHDRKKQNILIFLQWLLITNVNCCSQINSDCGRSRCFPVGDTQIKGRFCGEEE